MITTIKLSNKFIKSITLEDFLNNQNITRFFTDLIKDEYVYLIWDKEYFTTLYKKYKDFLNSSNFNKHIRIFTALKNKVQYLNNDIPIDIYLISNSEKNNAFKGWGAPL